MNTNLRSRRLHSLWLKTLETNNRAKIDRRHRKLVVVKGDVSNCSFLLAPFFVYNGKLFKDHSLKI
jgi:hypothetical protein